MAGSSQVESIFFAALEKKAGADRAGYLDQACGADAAVRLQVERLLESHPQAIDFLAQPAVDRRRFNSHDTEEDVTNVIAIYAVEDQPVPYIVMDYIAGRTLQQKLDATGPLELLDVLKIGRQVAAGLAAAHAMGLIHRDIKPGNILLEDSVERVKITDFGLARAADDASITRSGLVAGTPMHVAPEQAMGETIDQRADLFSLGSVLYTMRSGRQPFRAANTLAVLKRVVEDTPRPIREIIPEVPEWLCALISRLQAKNPADRITSAQDVADLLARRTAELEGNIPAVPDVPRPAEALPVAEIPKPARALRWLKFFNRRWAVVAAVLVMLLGCLGLAERDSDIHKPSVGAIDQGVRSRSRVAV